MPGRPASCFRSLPRSFRSTRLPKRRCAVALAGKVGEEGPRCYTRQFLEYLKCHIFSLFSPCLSEAWPFRSPIIDLLSRVHLLGPGSGLALGERPDKLSVEVTCPRGPKRNEFRWIGENAVVGVAI